MSLVVLFNQWDPGAPAGGEFPSMGGVNRARVVFPANGPWTGFRAPGGRARRIVFQPSDVFMPGHRARRIVFRNANDFIQRPSARRVILTAGVLFKSHPRIRFIIDNRTTLYSTDKRPRRIVFPGV
jgi:hypothetical protein